jgi:hypothetical protein
MARRADWMSNSARSFSLMSKVKEKHEEWKTTLKNSPKEADKLAARKHRLIGLFRSNNCYSANVHACTHGLRELVDSLVRLERVPAQTSAEGLRLLAQAWDEHRRPHKKMWFSVRRGPAAAASPNRRRPLQGCSIQYKQI